MSDIMKSIPFGQLMKWILAERKKGSVFGVDKPYVAKEGQGIEIFGRKLETAIGPAAGPNTQLAQNLIACYYAGARFFELKTVQIMDGEELSACINKPCILAEDEAYNCEWSTELYVPQALEEYIKAWVGIHVIAKEFGLGDPNGFQFNMSVGYNMEGIMSEKVDNFIESMKDASDTEVFKSCKEWLLANIDKFENITKEDVEALPAKICNSMTLSTMHGCPASEIERIAAYLLTEKHINTYVKCNPTLLGYEFVRKTMNDLGYDYMVFDDTHFRDDLQYEDAVPMLRRLKETAAKESLVFGVKLTNTFPVEAAKKELPTDEMYMSGRALYPLSIWVARKLSESFDGELPISFSGGADLKNIDGLLNAGIYPVTVATVILKSGGLKWLTKMADKIDGTEGIHDALSSGKVSVEDVKALAEDSLTNAAYQKGTKKVKVRKGEKSPLLDCLKKPSTTVETVTAAPKRVCGNCVDVCPNRANVLIAVPGMELMQIVHVDYMCNECGNCHTFCHYSSSPYKDKFTLFQNLEDMEDSTNSGFVVLDKESGETTLRVNGEKKTVRVFEEPDSLSKLVATVIRDYGYLL